jgi:hypothetical protein
MALGPGTPLSPVLFEHGAIIISGARVVDEVAVMRTTGQGATFQQVEGARLRPSRASWGLTLRR